LLYLIHICFFTTLTSMFNVGHIGSIITHSRLITVITFVVFVKECIMQKIYDMLMMLSMVNSETR